jgi:hypothetical protein
MHSVAFQKGEKFAGLMRTYAQNSRRSVLQNSRLAFSLPRLLAPKVIEFDRFLISPKVS